MEITLNEDQRLFVLPHGEGYSCMGFDVVYEHCLELEKRIKKYKLLPPGVTLVPVSKEGIGTMAQYQRYRELLDIVGTRKIGTWFSYKTPGKVRDILEQYRKEGGRIRLFYGDTTSGRCWMEEFDTMGKVGRSTGTLQIPLLIAPGEYGGPGILDNCIVRILDADTREELYRHKKYHLPEMIIQQTDDDLSAKGYTHGVWVRDRDGSMSNHVNFRSFGKAAQYVAFMSGECCEQPS